MMKFRHRAVRIFRMKCMEENIMNRIIVCCTLVLALAAVSPAYAGDPYEDGMKAALAGDYATAFEKWKPLGMQGEGDALFHIARFGKTREAAALVEEFNSEALDEVAPIVGDEPPIV